MCSSINVLQKGIVINTPIDMFRQRLTEDHRREERRHSGSRTTSLRDRTINNEVSEAVITSILEGVAQILRSHIYECGNYTLVVSSLPRYNIGFISTG